MEEHSFTYMIAMLLVIGAIVVACLSLLLRAAAYLTRAAQDRCVYYPNIPEDSTQVCPSPLDCGIDHAEMVHIRTADGLILRGYLMWPPRTHKTATPLLQQHSVGGKTVDEVVAVHSPNKGDPGAMEQDRRLSHSMTSTSATVVGALGRDELSSTSKQGSSGDTSTANTTGMRDRDVSPLASVRFTLLYFHGNAGNVGHRIEVARLLASSLQCAVLMVDYRGYGLSSRAEPSQEGLERDAQACLEYLWTDRRLPRNRIFVMGTSLGGAVAIHLAAHARNASRIRGLVIENTFTSLGDMASVIAKSVIHQHTRHCRGLLLRLFNCYLKPVGLMLRWNNVKTVQHVSMPILFLSGSQDEIVPAEQMHRLYKAANRTNRSRTLYTFPNGQHNNLMVEPAYTDVIRSFIDKTLHE